MSEWTTTKLGLHYRKVDRRTTAYVESYLGPDDANAYILAGGFAPQHERNFDGPNAVDKAKAYLDRLCRIVTAD